MVYSDSRGLGPSEALQHNLIINIPLFIPLAEGAIIKHVAYCHPHPHQRWACFLSSEAVPKLYAESPSDRPSLIISSDPEPDSSLERVSLLPVLSIMTAYTVLLWSTDGLLMRVPVCHWNRGVTGSLPVWGDRVSAFTIYRMFEAKSTQKNNWQK